MSKRPDHKLRLSDRQRLPDGIRTHIPGDNADRVSSACPCHSQKYGKDLTAINHQHTNQSCATIITFLHTAVFHFGLLAQTSFTTYCLLSVGTNTSRIESYSPRRGCIRMNRLTDASKLFHFLSVRVCAVI